MKVLSLITEIRAVGLLILLSYFLSPWFVLLTVLILILYFFTEFVGWRKGVLSSNDDLIIIEGEVPLSIPKRQLIGIETDSTSTFTSWYSYGIIELTTKKYDIKIKCRTKEMPELVLKISNMFKGYE